MGHKQTLAREARERRVLKLVLSRPNGIGITELFAITKIPMTTINVYLRTLREAGKVEDTQPRGGPNNQWGPVGIRARYEAENAEKLRLLAIRRERVRELAAQRKADEEAAAAFEQPCVHRIVPAHLAAPLRPQGPCSIFRMAA